MKDSLPPLKYIRKEGSHLSKVIQTIFGKQRTKDGASQNLPSVKTLTRSPS